MRWRLLSAAILLLGMALGCGDRSTTSSDVSPGGQAATPSRATADQEKAIADAQTFEELKRALKDAFPFISDVQWDKPTTSDPLAEIELETQSSVTTADNGGTVAEARRRELVGFVRCAMPALLKTKIQWGVAKIGGSSVFVFERALVGSVDFDNASDVELQRLSNKSAGQGSPLPA